jgi:hypothetical protein
MIDQVLVLFALGADIKADSRLVQGPIHRRPHWAEMQDVSRLSDLVHLRYACVPKVGKTGLNGVIATVVDPCFGR